MFSTAFLNQIRRWELDRIAQHFPAGARVLEIGAGTGQQALELANLGFDVEAIEVADSRYAGVNVFPIRVYDGASIPHPNGSFDIVFSSNVLEHVPDLARLHAEIRRVLRDNGHVVHVLPTPSWRWWTTLSALPAALQYVGLARNELRSHTRQVSIPRTWYRALRLAGPAFAQRPHGVRGNLISEAWYFRPSWWRRNFAANGFRTERDGPLGLFYTGNMLAGPKLDLPRRIRLARYLGSACHVFVLSSIRNRLPVSADSDGEKGGEGVVAAPHHSCGG